MIVIELVYLQPGQEAAFEAFEQVALARLAAHGGELLLRQRGGAALGGALDPPDELHIVRFPDEAAFAAFAADPERARVLPLKEAAVRTTWVVRAD